MKRFGYLFEKVYDIENLKLAHKNAKKGKKYYKEVKMVDSNEEYYLGWLSYILKNKEYKTSKYEVFTKRTDNGKMREIYKLPYYPDRIVHHAIIQVIGDIWVKTLIRDTFSSIKGRGIHDGFKRLRIALRDKENTKYCLKLDIKKYYQSIPNEKLKSVIRLKIKDKNLLYLLDEIISSTTGVPIGNYLSQYFGNLYISDIDHKIKSINKYYFRYCDDIVILAKNKESLHSIFDTLKYELELKGLTIKGNWQIFPVKDRGIDFLGYRFFHDYILLRKSIKMRMKRKFNRLLKGKRSIKSINSSVMSYWGWMKFGNCKNLENKILTKELCWEIKNRNNRKSNPLKNIK